MGWCVAHDPIVEIPDDELEAHLLTCLRDRPPALVLCFLDPAGVKLPPPWFVPVDEPACTSELCVPADRTIDNLARHFVCDKPVFGHDDGKHRQVTDNELGHSFQWPLGYYSQPG